MYYGQVLDRVHQLLLPRVYVEVGVRHGATLALALPCTTAVGIDPSPDVLVALGRNVTIHRQRSDDFFSESRLDDILHGGTIDVAFIDGMHLLEFAYRDFCNIERHASSNSVVFIHDCLPRSPDEASRVPIVPGWTGDVWKLLPLLAQLRPDLTITMIKSPPTGLVMIRNLDPESRELDPADEVSIEKFRKLEFDELGEMLKQMNVVEAQWESIAALLPSPYQQVGDVAALVEQRNSLKPDLPTRWRGAKRRVLQSSVGKDLLRLRHYVLRRKAGRDSSG